MIRQPRLIRHRAFTQLAADNQYAPLGLLLLGVLADIHVAVKLVLGKDDEAATEGGDLETTTVTATEDLGVAISREDVELVDEPGGDFRTPPAEAEIPAFKKPRGVDTRKKQKPKKQGDEFDALFSSLI